jgi:MmyB-like transcription regulator ligand binding domain
MSPPSPGSASSTTPNSNAARSPASPPPSLTPSPAPCSSTTPNEPTCSNSPTPPTAPAPACDPTAARASAGHLGRAWNGCSTASLPPRSSATAAWTCSRATTSAGPCTPPCTSPQPTDNPTSPRFTFLDIDAAHDFYPDWDAAADTCIAILRTEAGRDPHDKDLHDLVGELSTRSEEFRRRWSAHNVRYHGAGKHFHHYDVGDLQLAYESVDMISEPGLTLTLYAPEPGSPTAHALDLLASWTVVSNDATDNAHQAT